VGSEALPVGSEALPVRSEALPVRGEALPVRSEALPMRGEALPVRSEALPVRSEALPMRCEAPLAEHEISRAGTRETPGIVNEYNEITIRQREKEADNTVTGLQSLAAARAPWQRVAPRPVALTRASLPRSKREAPLEFRGDNVFTVCFVFII
jgi:hypothetical protein